MHINNPRRDNIMRYSINDVLEVLSESTSNALYNENPELFDELVTLYEYVNNDEKTDLEIVNDIYNSMKSIQYGSFDKNGKELKGEEIEDSCVQKPRQVLTRKKGMCVDQVELEKYLFDNSGIKYETYYVSYTDKDGDTPYHVFLVFKTDNKYYWFEHSWGSCRGIHEYSSKNELFADILQKHCEKYINDGKIVKYTENLIGKDQEYITNLMENKSSCYKK